MQADSFVSDMNRFINFWLWSMVTLRRETQFLKAYANHTMLTTPQRTVHLVMFKISVHHCWSRSARLNGRKLNYCLSKSSNSQDHLFCA